LLSKRAAIYPSDDAGRIVALSSIIIFERSPALDSSGEQLSSKKRPGAVQYGQSAPHMAFRLRSLLTEINFDLDIDEVTIGRDPSCHLSLDDGLISNVHAVLRRSGNGNIELRDAGSRNGTKLNGRRITEPTQLQHGDRIGVGTREVVFLNATESDEVASVRQNTTAKFDTCAGCGSSCPSELDICPRCGETSRLAKQIE
jgi:hypothetical protein